MGDPILANTLILFVIFTYFAQFIYLTLTVGSFKFDKLCTHNLSFPVYYLSLVVVPDVLLLN